MICGLFVQVLCNEQKKRAAPAPPELERSPATLRNSGPHLGALSGDNADVSGTLCGANGLEMRAQLERFLWF